MYGKLEEPDGLSGMVQLRSGGPRLKDQVRATHYHTSRENGIVLPSYLMHRSLIKFANVDQTWTKQSTVLCRWRVATLLSKVSRESTYHCMRRETSVAIACNTAPWQRHISLWHAGQDGGPASLVLLCLGVSWSL